MKLKPKTGEPTYTLTEVALAVQLAAGGAVADTAEVLEISEKWAYTLRDRSREAIDALSVKLRPLCRVNKREMMHVAREKAEEELEKRFGASLATLDDAMQKGDYALAYMAGKEIRDRLLGKAATTVNVNQQGSITHTHYLAKPEALAAFDDDVIADREFHSRVKQLRSISAPLEAIDVHAE